ncbi:hypothetical protein [Flavobacterium sp. WV_118_3]|uniref:P-loop ATPase, Sll1717 family n=1 Tax=Flavobacterium sp. WV_118_3 TaxID=3151764 RepID=UPI00321A8B3D
MNLIDWLDFGKVSAERDELLIKYFYDNGVLRKIVSDNLSFLILGRKGAGKTAVFKYLTENPNHTINDNDVLIPLSFDNYNWNIHSLLTNSDKAESHSYRQSWKFVILVEAIKCITEHFKNKKQPIPQKIDRAHKILEKLFDSPVPTIYQIIGKKILSLSKFSLPKAGVDLESGSLDSFELGGGEIEFDEVKSNKSLQQSLSENIENLINFLDNALQSVKNKDFRIFICFDKVDEAWDEVSYDSSKKVIAGLVSACDSLTIQYKGFLRPIIFLREDIFEVLSLNDSNKLREDCGELLHWNRNSIQKMILARVNHFAQENGIDLFSDTENLFENKEMRQRAKPFNYIIKRTMMRPRDVIAFLSRILDAMKDKANDPFGDTEVFFTTIDSASIYNAEPGYSEWLRQEILDEWSVQNPIIADLLNSLRNNASTNFTTTEFEVELKKLRPATNSSEIFEYLKFLFDNSIIGFKLGSSTEWRFKCFYPSQGFLASSEYRVHEGLVRALNLKENRE